MDIESMREYCLLKKAVKEEFPFGESTLVFKVKEKIFLLVGLDRSPLQFNVKCDPEKAVELREEYDAILPGYHMNKKHWNTVIVDGRLGEKLLRQLIDHSYDLVVQSLSGKTRKGIL
ncbi:MAG: MmcQ/YjbR family DNA-binding protein [Chitinophagales bacterium]